VTRAQEHFYESGRLLWWADILQDVSFAVRVLRKAPAFTTLSAVSDGFTVFAASLRAV